jgi:uncharacterized protein YukJ
MPLQSYGVLAARAVGRRREAGSSDSPHFQIHLVDAGGTAYRCAVNVLSQLPPSELLYVADEDFRHPLTDLLPAEPVGWTPLPSRPGAASLDFIRGNLFDPDAMRPLPPDVPGQDNDLADRLDHFTNRAVADPTAVVYAFGERWGPEEGNRDKVFGFTPGNGVHDIHMNQGNAGRFARDNGVWQDGGLLLRFPGDGRWVAVFLAFQSQAWHTDDVTGDALPGTPGRPPTEPEDRPVRIVAALVNPVGGAPEGETITLLNASPAPVDLAGWRIADRLKRSCAVGTGPVAPGATVVVPLADGVLLGNDGGAITLLDPEGLKVDGVAYTGAEAADEGWTLVF